MAARTLGLFQGHHRCVDIPGKSLAPSLFHHQIPAVPSLARRPAQPMKASVQRFHERSERRVPPRKLSPGKHAVGGPLAGLVTVGRVEEQNPGVGVKRDQQPASERVTRCVDRSIGDQVGPRLPGRFEVTQPPQIGGVTHLPHEFPGMAPSIGGQQEAAIRGRQLHAESLLDRRDVGLGGRGATEPALPHHLGIQLTGITGGDPFLAPQLQPRFPVHSTNATSIR